MKTLQLGILSVSGFFQKKIAIPVAKSPLIDIAAIASRSQEKADAAAARFNIPKAYGSYDALLGDKNLDAVYIPLPNHLHDEYIKKAADAGKHVICEKPIALNAQRAEDSISYAANQGVKVMEAFMYRFHPQWQHTCELIRMKEIGQLQSVQTAFSFNNTDPKNIRNRPDAGGGALLDIGCYAVSVSRFLTGKEPKRAVSLMQKDPNFGTDTLLSGMLDFGGGQRASFTVGTKTFPYQRVTAIGSSGMIVIEIPFNIPSDVDTRIFVTNSIGTREVIIPPEDQYILEFEAFAKAILEGHEVPTPPQDAIQNMKVLDALRISSENNSWVEIN